MNVKHINENEYRIFVISDVHGSQDLLKRLIEKLNIKPEDYLVLLGDYINKGDGGLETLRYIRKLQKRPRTYVLKGNHEYSMHKIFTDEKLFKKMYDRINNSNHNLINDILIEDGKKYSDFDVDSLFKYLNSKKEIIKQLDEFLTVLFFDNFVFIHAGYDRDFYTSNEYKYLKWDTYNDDSEINDMIVVVGHMPVSNFRDNVLDTRPYYNKEKHIIFIDGGVGVKRVSELNALIIDKHRNKITYDYLQENNFEEKKVIMNIPIKKDSEKVFVTYPNFNVEVLSRSDKFSVCRYLKNGKRFKVFSSMIKNYKLTYNYTNNFLSVPEGDKVYVCYYYEDYALVKYKNEFGWIKKESILWKKL